MRDCWLLLTIIGRDSVGSYRFTCQISLNFQDFTVFRIFQVVEITTAKVGSSPYSSEGDSTAWSSG